MLKPILQYVAMSIRGHCLRVYCFALPIQHFFRMPSMLAECSNSMQSSGDLYNPISFETKTSIRADYIHTCSRGGGLHPFLSQTVNSQQQSTCPAHTSVSEIYSPQEA